MFYFHVQFGMCVLILTICMFYICFADACILFWLSGEWLVSYVKANATHTNAIVFAKKLVKLTKDVCFLIFLKTRQQLRSYM